MGVGSGQVRADRNRFRDGASLIALALFLVLSTVACGGSTGPDRTAPTTATPVAPSTQSTEPPPTTLVELTGPYWFATPTRNIACVVRGGEARCDVVERTWSAPAKPSDCPFDWGPTLGVQGSSAGRFVCVSDSVFDAPDTVPWGSAVRGGSAICEVRPEGVTCRTDVGHGFFLSEESYRLF